MSDDDQTSYNLNQNSTKTVISEELKYNNDDNETSNEINVSINDDVEDTKPEQRILVCIGVPGSGKSTFSKKLCQVVKIWYRVNQDDLGSRKACENVLKAKISEGKNVIVDRCNFDREQRKTWINLARHFKLPIDAIILDTPYEICEKRILEREDHPTQVHGNNGLNILKNFKQMFKLPDYNEGFERILSVEPHEINDCSEDDIKEIMKKFDEIPKRVFKRSEGERERKGGWRGGKGKSRMRRGWGGRGRAINSHSRNYQETKVL